MRIRISIALLSLLVGALFALSLMTNGVRGSNISPVSTIRPTLPSDVTVTPQSWLPLTTNNYKYVTPSPSPTYRPTLASPIQ